MFSLSEFNINDVSDIMLKEKIIQIASELGMSEGDLIDKLISDSLKSNLKLKLNENSLSDADLIRIFKEESEKDKNIYDGKNGNFDELLELIELRNRF